MAFKTSKEIYTGLENLATAKPNWCKLGVMPESSSAAWGFAMEYVLITKNAQNYQADPKGTITYDVTVAGDKVGVFINAGTHGDEKIPPEAALAFAEELVNLASGGIGRTSGGFKVTANEIQDMVAMLDIFVSPLLNPDGRDRNTRTNPNDVNLNRNFPLLNSNNVFNYPAYYAPGAGPAIDPRDKAKAMADYSGKAPANQAETRNLIVLLDYPNITFYFDLHTGQHNINYPWNFEAAQTTNPKFRYCATTALADGPNAHAYDEYIPPKSLDDLSKPGGIGLFVRDGIRRAGGPLFPVQQSVDLGIVTGASDDYFFSLDVCNNRSLTFDFDEDDPAGNDPPALLDAKAKKNQATHDAMVNGLFAGLLWIINQFKGGLSRKRQFPSPPCTPLPCEGATAPDPPKALPPGMYYATLLGPGGGPDAGPGAVVAVLPSGVAVLAGPVPSPAQETPHRKEECGCCKVVAKGHCGRFDLPAGTSAREQVIFAASPLLAAKPPLAYLTISNHGPAAIDVSADTVPPAAVTPGNSITVAVTSSVKVACAAGASSKGRYVISWCCPTPVPR